MTSIAAAVTLRESHVRSALRPASRRLPLWSARRRTGRPEHPVERRRPSLPRHSAALMGAPRPSWLA